MAFTLIGGKFKETNSAGVPLAGGLLWTYAAGTTNPLATYTTSQLNVANTNPVVLDAAGRANVWLDVVSYHFVLEDASSNLIWDVDNVQGHDAADAARAAALSASSGSSLVGYIASGAGAVARTAQSKMRDVVSVFDYMTAAQIADVEANTLLVDVRAAVQAAVNAVITRGSGTVYFPPGRYLIVGVAGSDTMKNGILLPFSTVNPDPSTHIKLTGPGASLYCGANDMILLRISRNCVTAENLLLYGNGYSTVWGVGIVPESMTQVTTTVSQQFVTLTGISRTSFDEGIVLQPGPTVGGSDSGCFFNTIRDGNGNLNTRHVYLKKGIDFAVSGNRPTRTMFFNETLLRGNTGYYIDCGSEVQLHACFEELIDDGSSPLASPTARFISADASNIEFYGGYSEACTVSADFAANNVTSFGYIPSSGSDLDFIKYAESYHDGVSDDRAWTPVLASSGGGAQGATTSTGRVTKQGKIANFTCQISADKGTLGVGTISISGLPYTADTGWTGAGFQGLSVTSWSGITFSANVFTMAAYITGATISIMKLHAAAGTPAGLTVAECADPIVFTVQGTYKVA